MIVARDRILHAIGIIGLIDVNLKIIPELIVLLLIIVIVIIILNSVNGTHIIINAKTEL